MAILNNEVLGYRDKLNRYIEELIFSQSSNGSEFLSYDLVRLKSYVSALRFYLDYMKNVPLQDLPETNPREYGLRQDPEIKEVENEMVNHLVRLFELCRDEMDKSQSARRSSGLLVFDYDRAHQYLDRVDQYIADYIEQATPLDLPESSPRAAIQGPGK